MKRIYVPEINQTVRLKLSTHAIRTIDKKGLMAYLKSEGKTLKDIM
jgi:large subunit ribosomal protein L28